jgi:hypothetical protein
MPPYRTIPSNEEPLTLRKNIKEEVPNLPNLLLNLKTNKSI